jgi:hypothetical protein
VTKQSKRVLGVPVLCGIEGLAQAIAHWRVDAVIVSSGKITPERSAILHAICYESGTALFHLDFQIQAVSLSRSAMG